MITKAQRDEYRKLRYNVTEEWCVELLDALDEAEKTIEELKAKIERKNARIERAESNNDILNRTLDYWHRLSDAFEQKYIRADRDASFWFRAHHAHFDEYTPCMLDHDYGLENKIESK